LQRLIIVKEEEAWGAYAQSSRMEEVREQLIAPERLKGPVRLDFTAWKDGAEAQNFGICGIGRVGTAILSPDRQAVASVNRDAFLFEVGLDQA